MMNLSSGPAIATMIGAIVLTATAADVLLASAMRTVGDLDQIKAARGLPGAIWAVVSEGRFLAGVVFMALSFFSLLFSLSHADVSLIAPAAGSLTFVSNALAAKMGPARECRSPALASGPARLLRRRPAQALTGKRGPHLSIEDETVGSGTKPHQGPRAPPVR